MTLIFWVSMSLIIYIYIGYPLILNLLTINKKKIKYTETEMPSVSILIAAYNEENDIEATLLNKIELDYPEDKLEIIVVSDESTDETDAIVERIAALSDIPITLVRQVPRRGKTAGLNLVVPQAKGDIIVFSDANSVYKHDALKHLVSNFADQRVGYVTGKMVYTNPDGSLVGDGCSSYMKYENWLRDKESKLGSLVGVDGGIDAMRKELYEQLNPDQLPDFVQPLKVVKKGYRVVYEENALLKEMALDDAGSEYAMRVRVTLRALWAMHDMRVLFNPFRFGFFAWQLLSHKLLRYLAFIPLFVVYCHKYLTAERCAYISVDLFRATLILLSCMAGASKYR